MIIFVVPICFGYCELKRLQGRLKEHDYVVLNWKGMTCLWHRQQIKGISILISLLFHFNEYPCRIKVFISRYIMKDIKLSWISKSLQEHFVKHPKFKKILNQINIAKYNFSGYWYFAHAKKYGISDANLKCLVAFFTLIKF